MKKITLALLLIFSLTINIFAGVNFPITVQDDHTISIAFVDSDGNDFSLTNYTFEAYLKENKTDTDANALVSWDNSDFSTSGNDTSFEMTTTDNNQSTGIYYLDVRMYDASNNRTKVFLSKVQYILAESGDSTALTTTIGGTDVTVTATLASGIATIENAMTANGDFIQGSGAGSYRIVTNALGQTAGPTTGDDINDGYTVSSRWYDTTNDKEYVAMDVTSGNAVWVETTAGASGGEANTASSVGSGTSVVKQKAGVDLEFNAIKSENNLLAVALDGVSNDIELTVSQTNINAGVSITANQVTDFDTEVDNNISVVANTAKVTNATHSGDASGSTTLTLQNAAITGKSTEKATSGDFILFSDTTDSGNLKKANFDDFGYGEANTASSQGAGASIFYQKSSVDLQFNGIKSENNALSVTVDAVSNDVEFTVNEANIDHDALTNFLSTEHFTQAAISITESQVSDLDHDDTDAIHDNVAGEINAVSEKGSPASGDWILIEDSADSNNKKKIQIGNLPTGSGMSNFTLSGDLGTPQTITDGNTVTIAGGTSIETTAGATDTVTITLDSTTAAAVSANTTHISSNGSDHVFIDQSVVSGASPTFTATNFTGSSGITGLGTVTSGVWNGTSISDLNVDNNITIFSGSVGNSGITLDQSTNPTPTVDGLTEWDNDDNQIKIGDGAGTKTFSDDSVVLARANHTGTQTASTISDFASTVQATKIDDLTEGDDNTDLDSTTLRHGLLPKLGGGTTNFLRADGTWAAPAGGGDVSGPGASTDHALVRWNSTTGTSILNSGAILSDANGLTGLTALTVDNVTIDGNDITASGVLTFTGDVNFDSNTLFVDDSTNRIGIGTASPLFKLDVAETTNDVATVLFTHESATLPRGIYTYFPNFTGDATQYFLRCEDTSAVKFEVKSNGAVSTGTWQGTAISDTYVANDLTLAGGTIGTSAITLVQSSGPTPTSEGVIEWDTDDDYIVVGDGTNSRKFSDEDFLIIAASDETTDLTTGTSKITFRFPPYACTIIEAGANCNTAPVGSTLTFDINESGTTILSTKITIDASEKTSETAATAPVLSDTSIAADAEMTIDIDQVGSSTAGKGAKIWFRYRRT